MGYKSPHPYVLNIGFDTSNPSDSTTYYIGVTNRVLGTTAGDRRIYIPIAGIIKIVDFLFNSSGGAASSNENLSIYLRINNTTDYLIKTIGDTSNYKRFVNTAFDIPVTESDYLELKMVCPAWVTNPTTVFGIGQVVITTE